MGADDFGLAFVLRQFPQSFELALMVIAAVLVFPQTLFLSLTPLAAIGAGLALCGLAPLVTSLPIPVFDLIQRRHGRGVRVTIAMVMLGTSTAAIGFLPDGGRTGALAVLMLIGCRVLQGLAGRGLALAARGVGDGPTPTALGLSFRLVQLGRYGAVGVLAASLLFGGLFFVLDRADFLQWGWRYPFIIAIPCNIVALFATLRLLGAPGGDTGGRGVRLATLGGVPVGQGED